MCILRPSVKDPNIYFSTGKKYRHLIMFTFGHQYTVEHLLGHSWTFKMRAI